MELTLLLVIAVVVGLVALAAIVGGIVYVMNRSSPGPGDGG